MKSKQNIVINPLNQLIIKKHLKTSYLIEFNII